MSVMAQRSKLPRLQAVSSAVCLVIAILVAESKAQCWGDTSALTATSTTRSLTPPDFSLFSPTKINCTWLLQTSYPFGSIKIDVMYLNMDDDCYSSQLEIFDGVWVLSPRLARLCGNMSKNSFSSSGPSALISFKTNETTEQNFFYITYKAQISRDSFTTTQSTSPNPGPQTIFLTADSVYIKYFTSPNYPDLYPPNANYTWLIQSEMYDYKVQIVIETFNLENSTYCMHDRLEIFDGGSEYYPSLARLCGNQSYLTFYSSGPTALISLKTNSYIQGSGFSIAYIAMWLSNTATTTVLPWWTQSLWMNEPPTTLLTAASNYVMYFTSPNYPERYPPNSNYTWLIQTERYDYKIMIIVENVSLENSTQCMHDRLEIFDGAHEYYPSLARLCGNQSDLTFYSSGSTALVSLKTNSYFQGSGFSIAYKAVWISDTALTTPLPWWTQSPLMNGPPTTYLRAASDYDMYFTSPNYPDLYPPNANYTWSIESDYNYKIMIVVENLRLENSTYCMNDRLEIFDGGSEYYPTLARLCGNQSYLTFYSSGSSALVSLKTNSYLQGSGFRIAYKAVWISDTATTTPLPWWTQSPRMNGPPTTFLTAGSDYIMYFTSPNYPDLYPPNVNYTWLIQTERYGYKVLIVIEKLRLENSAYCMNDRLEIFDGAYEYYPSLARLCGNQSDLTFYSSGSTALVSLKTNSYLEDSGFSITYSAVLFSETATNTTFPWWTTDGSSSSICDISGYTLRAEYINAKYIDMYYDNEYPNNANCAWKLLSELDYVIHVHVINMDVEFQDDCQYDAVTLYDAPWVSNLSVIAKVCGRVGLTVDYYSSGSAMYVTFTSDSSKTGKGFRLMYEAVRSSDVPASSSPSSYSVGVIVGVVVGVVGFTVIAVLGILIIVSKRRQARRRHTARRLRAAQNERLHAPPPYTTLSSHFLCDGLVLGPQSEKPGVEGRPDVGCSNPLYAHTAGYRPFPTYADLLILGNILPDAGHVNVCGWNNSSSGNGDVSAKPSAQVPTAGSSDTTTVLVNGSLQPKRTSTTGPPTYDDVMHVTGASTPLLITASASDA